MTQLYKKNGAVAPAFCRRQIWERTKFCKNCKYRRLEVLETEALDFDKDESIEPVFARYFCNYWEQA